MAALNLANSRRRFDHLLLIILRLEHRWLARVSIASCTRQAGTQMLGVRQPGGSPIARMHRDESEGLRSPRTSSPNDMRLKFLVPLTLRLGLGSTFTAFLAVSRTTMSSKYGRTVSVLMIRGGSSGRLFESTGSWPRHQRRQRQRPKRTKQPAVARDQCLTTVAIEDAKTKAQVYRPPSPSALSCYARAFFLPPGSILAPGLSRCWRGRTPS